MTRSSLHETRAVRPARYWPALALLLIAALACSLTNTGRRTPTPTPSTTSGAVLSGELPAAPQPLPPALVETDPPPGAELPLGGALTLYFNQPMDRSSVESALVSQGAVAGGISWRDDSTLVFQPGASLPPDAEFHLALGKAAQSEHGLPLQEPVEIGFRTAGSLRLAQVLPEPGAVEVDPLTAVVAAFDRPVVALGAEQEGLPPAFNLEPPAAGRGEWVNTSTYIFYPESGLSGGVQYTARLNPGLRSAAGAPLLISELLLDGAWSFFTAMPRLVSLQPPGGSQSLGLRGPLVLSFNQAMDPTSVGTSLRLYTSSGALVPLQSGWSADFTTLAITPTGLLARGTDYGLSLEGSARARGGTALGKTFTASLRTVPSLGLRSSDPLPGGQKRPYASVTLYFNGPIDERPVVQHPERYLTLHPAVSNLNTWWNEDDFSLVLSGEFDPSLSYLLTVSPELPDRWGGMLGQAFNLAFNTLPLDPSLSLISSSGVFFLTPEDAGLAAQATNLASLPLTVGSTTLEDMIRMLGPQGYDFRAGYTPSDAQTWQQPLSYELNKSQDFELFVTPDHMPLPPGLYSLRLNVQQQVAFSGPYLLVVGNIQVTFKMSATDALVWAVDLRSNTPLPAAPVRVYDENGALLASGTTDEQGVSRLSLGPLANLYAVYYAVVGQPGEPAFGLALSTWNEGVSSWDFGLSADYSPPRLQAYLYTDRPIYRPGQAVYFRGVARQAHNGRYDLPGKATFPLSIYDPNGTELASLDLPLSAFGTFHSEYRLPPAAQPGMYRLGTKDSQVSASLEFQVANYRKPEIDLQVSLPSDQVLAGQSLTAEISARYFFDAPAGNVSVQWRLYSAASRFDLPGYQVGAQDTSWLETFNFGRFGSDLGELVAEGEGRTGPDGRLQVGVDMRVAMNRQHYTLEATASDESGLPVSARLSLLVNPAEFYIALRPDRWVAQAGQQAGFDVQVVDWNKNPAGVRDLLAEYFKVVWVRSEADPAQLYTGPTFTPQYTLVGSASFTTSELGQARLAFDPPEPGTFLLVVSGGGARSELLQWVAGPGQAAWPSLPNQRLRLTADKIAYQPGETAQVFIPNPFPGKATALLSVERGVVLRHQVLSLEPGGSMASLLLTGEDAPNVYVSVTVLGKDGGGEPDFRQGYLELDVAPSAFLLQAELASTPSRVGPGEPVTFDLLVRDAAGVPVQGEFSLSVVDRAVLALADPNAPDIVPAFYGPQPLGVRTGLGLAAYAHRRAILPPGLGGGGDGGPTVVRQEFPDTTYWNAQIVTDAQGHARVSLELPDSLTTWQVLVRGVTASTQVGQAELDLVTTKELLVRPVTPRFLVVDDHSLLAAIVQNNSDGELLARVSLAGAGFVLDDPGAASQMVSVPAGGRTRVDWWGTVQDVQSLDLLFSAEAGELKDASHPVMGALPVLRYTAPQTFRTAGVLSDPGTLQELVSLPRSFDVRGGSLELELTPSLAAALLPALDALEETDYELSEQAASRLLANLEAARALQAVSAEDAALQERMATLLPEGLSGLLARQNIDGGWGWWQGSESDATITAYALVALARAAQYGMAIDPAAMQRAADALRAGLLPVESVTAAEDAAWQLDRLVLVHFALAQAGQPDPSAGTALYSVRDQLDPWAQALLALFLEQTTPGNELSRTLRSDLGARALRTASGAHWESLSVLPRNMHTPLSTSAVVLYVLAQAPTGESEAISPLLADGLRYLMAHRQAGGGWDTPFTTAWTALALSASLQSPGESSQTAGAFSATLNGAPLLSGQAGGQASVTASVPLSQLYPDSPNTLRLERLPSPGQLYYTAGLRVHRPVEDIAPLAQGLHVSRQYFPQGAACLAQSCLALTKSQAGQRITARLSLTLPQAAYYLLVEDHLPAGAEVLDTSLKTSEQGGFAPQQSPLYDPLNPFARGWGWWYFSQPQIYDQRIAWSADYLPAGSYELTYTLVLLQPGDYRVLPARAWQYYFPEVQGSSDGMVFSVEQ